MTKVANFSSNIGGTLVFLILGQGSIIYAMIMAIGAFLGGYSGALLMTRITTQTVRKLVITATSIMLAIQVYSMI